MEDDEHKYLKMCCAKLGMTIKQFVTSAAIERVDDWEDKWMLERWERDGTRDEIEKERNNPERTVFELNFDGTETSFVETTYSNVERRANGL
jgi:hypothetical protein